MANELVRAIPFVLFSIVVSDTRTGLSKEEMPAPFRATNDCSTTMATEGTPESSSNPVCELSVATLSRMTVETAP